MPKLARLPFLAAILSMLPLLIWLPRFKLLYWFHDDWDLLDDWTTFGTAAWIRQPMAENFGVVSKLAWVGAVHLTGGSYLGMVALIWITHLLVLLLFAMLLARCDFPEGAAAIAVLLVGLAWTNIEMLTWATQWSSLLCTMCLLIAWVAIAGKLNRWAAALAVAAILLGGTMFARGISYGSLLGIFLFLTGRHRRFAMLLFALSLILFIPYGHLLETYPTLHGVDSSRVAAMISWAKNYLLLNPFYLLISYPHHAVNAAALWIFGALKILLIVAGLRIANQTQRRVLWTLLLFEIATAVLITSGRYNTGAAGEISSRYQYVPLLCLGPFLGLVVSRIARTKPGLIACMIALGLGIALPWGWHMQRWSYERGTQVKEAIAVTPDDRKFGLPDITAGRARELIAKYGLH